MIDTKTLLDYIAISLRVIAWMILSSLIGFSIYFAGSKVAFLMLYITLFVISVCLFLWAFSRETKFDKRKYNDGWPD